MKEYLSGLIKAHIRKVKVIGGIISAIILGAIGSGVWQYIIEPALSTSSQVILSLATLGIESFKNDLYREVAKGFHEGASNKIYFQINFLWGMALLIFPLYSFLEFKRLIQQKTKMLEELKKIESGKDKCLPSIDELRTSLLNLIPKRILISIYISIVLGIFVFSACCIASARNNYVSSAVTHYFQLKRIISPYISQEEIKAFDSRFSQIQSARDYKVIVSQVISIAEQNGAKHPVFKVWE